MFTLKHLAQQAWQQPPLLPPPPPLPPPPRQLLADKQPISPSSTMPGTLLPRLTYPAALHRQEGHQQTSSRKGLCPLGGARSTLDAAEPNGLHNNGKTPAGPPPATATLR